MYGLEPADVGKMIKRHSPNGCTKCNNLGYSGRIAVMELLPIDREASEQIVQNNISALGLEVFIRARNPALKSLQTQGRELLLSGKTDAAALLDVINMGY
jgi:type II secretory ATPase GspE/PulE/Tfp pilus assembly ATPase PilB-like protein